MIDIKNKNDSLKDFNGILLVDKPGGITSYDVIRAIKKVFF